MSKRYALLKSGSVQSVILAAPEFFERADPRWLAQYDEIVEADRDAEPGATYDGQAKAFTRSATPPAKSRDEQLEERLAALEAKGR